MKEKLIIFFTNKRNVIIFFLASVLLLISTLIFTNFEIIAYQVNTVMHNIKMAAVDVDGFEISTVLIDQDGREYNSLYQWNATDRYDIRTLTLQINYKKTNNLTYEAGDLVFTVPNMLTRQSYIYGGTSSANNGTAISSDPCNLSEKTTTWNYSSNPDRCSTAIYSYQYDNLYFTNTQKVEANTNFEGSIRIMYTIEPANILNGLDNTFRISLNDKIYTNNLRFKFTSNKATYTWNVTSSKIEGYDGLPSDANQYIWIKLTHYDDITETGVRYQVNQHNYENNIHSSEGLSYDSYRYGPRYKFTLPANAIVYAPKDGYTHEVENGIDYYRYNGNYYYYNGDFVGFGVNDIYIGLPKSQYTNKTVSYTVDEYAIYSDWASQIDETKPHSYERIATFTESIKTSNYVYNAPSSSEQLTLYNFDINNALDVNNLKTGIDASVDFNVVYSGTKLDVKIGNDVFFKKNSSGTISQLSDTSYYFHKIQFCDYYMTDGSANPLLPINSIDLYVRHRGSSAYVKYGDSFYITDTKHYFNFEENDIVGFYFLIHDVDTSILSSRYGYTGINYSPIVYNAVFEDNSINSGDTLYTSMYIIGYKNNTSTRIYTPTSSSYTGDIASKLRTYDSSTHGHYVTREVYNTQATTTLDFLRQYKGSSTLESSVYKRNVYKTNIQFDIRNYSYDSLKTGYIKDNNGYELYYYLPEGFYADAQNSLKIVCYGNNNSFIAGNIKKQDGSTFSSVSDYCNYVNNHASIQITNNWNNTNRALVKVKVDYTSAPLNFRNYHYESSLNDKLDLPESVTLTAFYDKENLAEYNQSRFKFDTFMKTIGAPDDLSGALSNSYKDTLDINSNGNTSEYLYKSSKTLNVMLTGESNQDLMSFVRSANDNYTSEKTNVGYNEEYSYKLRARTAGNKITNVVIYDNLENNIKQNGEFVKASGNDTNVFRGTFVGVDTSYAQNQGYVVKVYYSQSETPGALDSDSSWSLYNESSTDKTKVKSLAFEFYKSNGTTKAIIPEDSLTYVEVKMKSPASVENDKTIAYNGSWVEWNALDLNNNVVPNIVGISSNIVNVSIPTILKVKHLIKDTTTPLVQEETYEKYGGDEYTTSITTNIPSDYKYDSTAGDPTSGTISKTYTEVIYYYTKKDPILTSSLNLSGTSSINTRGKQVSYQITYSPSVKNFIGTANVQIVDTLPYEIDTTKSYSLDGGTYDANNKTITWNKTITTTTIDKKSESFTVNISFSYKNIPVTVRSITNKATGTITALSKTASTEKTKNTSITEQFSLTVHHYYMGTTDSISPDVITYYNGGATYNTSPANVPADYDVITPPNSSGIIDSAEKVVTYFYERKDPVLSGNITNSGTESISSFNDKVEYSVTNVSSIGDYIGNVTIEIVDTLPYEIDTEKEYDLNGGVYDAQNKTITWTNTYNKTNVVEETLTNTYNISLVYKDVERTDRGLTNDVVARTTLENKNLVRNTSYTTSVDVKGKIIVNYIDKDTEREIHEPTVSEDTIYTNKYVPEALDIDTYKLVESPKKNEYDYEEEVKILYFKYEKKKHNITTKAIGTNGTIKGDEVVDEGSNSKKDNIIIKAKEGYMISKVTVNGEAIEIKSGLAEYTLAYFTDVREDKLVVVEFARKPENPPTGAFTPILITTIIAISSGLLYVFFRKKLKFKRI